MAEDLAAMLGVKLCEDSPSEEMGFWDLNRMLVGHWVASKDASKGHYYISISVDKSRVFGHGTMNGFIALVTNVAYWCFCQVMNVSSISSLASPWVSRAGAPSPGSCV